MRELGGTTWRVLDALQEHIARRGYPPTVRELAQAVGLRTPSAVHYHLDRLERLGMIERAPGRSRAIRIVQG